MRPGIVGFAGLWAGDLAALVGLRPDFGSLVRKCTDLPHWVALVSADRAVAALAGPVLWCAAAWLALGLLAASAAALPGTSGRAGAAACRALLPGVLRKLLAGSAGVGVLLSPALASACRRASASASPVTRAPASASAHRPRGSAARPGAAAATPVTGTPPAGGPPCPDPADGSCGSRRPVRDRRGAGAPGDSLWLLAARAPRARAPPTPDRRPVAALVRANREVIGDDPDLITPGQVLHVPAPSPRRRAAEHEPLPRRARRSA